jgi:hypothetical protein
MVEKSKAERLEETLTILKKLPEVGFATDSYQYKQVLDHMSAWVKFGVAQRVTLDFVSHTGELFLPDTEGKVSSLDLKVKR